MLGTFSCRANKKFLNRIYLLTQIQRYEEKFNLSEE